MVMGEGQFHDRAERQAKNFPVQGGLMEVIKDAMLKFPQYLRMQVHDELLWLVPDSEVADFVVELEENLNSDPYDCIPYVWDIHTGKNWGEAKG
jgi:DNA polymerase-1